MKALDTQRVWLGERGPRRKAPMTQMISAFSSAQAKIWLVKLWRNSTDGGSRSAPIPMKG